MITGASSGIGKAPVQAFAHEGNPLLLILRLETTVYDRADVAD